MALSVKTSRKRKQHARIKRVGAASISTANGYRKYAQQFHWDVEDKEVSAIVKEYVKKTFNKADASAISKNEDWRYVKNHVAAYCYWKMNIGEVSEEGTDAWFKNMFEECIERGRKVVVLQKKEEKVKKYVPSIQERMREQLGDIIGEFEAWLDEQPKTDIPKFFAYLQKNNVAQAHIGKIRSFYEPIQAEFAELTKKDCHPDLREGYAHLSKSDIKKYLKWFDTLFADLDAYENAKRATRKTRKPKMKSATQLVKKVQYKAQDADLKITSIDPASIIDANVLYAFNTKYNTLTVFVSDTGLSVKGTTVTEYDEKQSIKKKIRKPAEFIPQILKGTKIRNNKLVEALSTKPGSLNGRLGKDTVLLRVIK